MKKIVQNIFSFLIVGAAIASCKKDENRINLTGSTKPELRASSTADLVLSKPNALQHAVTLAWTNPEYQFTTGVSSQDVTYYIQFDTVGANFSTPKNTGDILVAKDLGIDLNDSVLNRSIGKIGKNGLQNDVPHDIEIRIKAVLKFDNVPVYSDPIQIRITPYLDVAVAIPSTNALYLVGSAAPGSWDNPIAPAHVTEQTFAPADPLDPHPTVYELTVHLAGGQEFLVIPDNGSWANKYAVHDKTVADLKKGGEFGYNGGNSYYNDNMPGPDDAGNYKLTFDFRSGTYTVVKL